jgi:hypothetical protein
LKVAFHSWISTFEASGSKFAPRWFKSFGPWCNWAKNQRREIQSKRKAELGEWISNTGDKTAVVKNASAEKI